VSEEERPLRKILFEADKESVWAFDLGDNLYRIDNVPFVTALVNYGDVVVGEQLEDAGPGFMRFLRVHSRGGHSTIWVYTNTDEKAAESAESSISLRRAAAVPNDRRTWASWRSICRR